MTDWSLLSGWQHVLPPNRPDEANMRVLEQAVLGLPNRSVACVLGSTPEYRMVLSRLFDQVVIIDRSAAFKATSDSILGRAYPNETFANQDWLDALPEHRGSFDLIASHFTHGNVAFNDRAFFFRSISTALNPTGIFCDTIFHPPQDLYGIGRLVDQFHGRPLNLTTFNDFNAAAVFQSERIREDGCVDSSAIYAWLRENSPAPWFDQLILGAELITPPGLRWDYHPDKPAVGYGYNKVFHLDEVLPASAGTAFADVTSVAVSHKLLLERCRQQPRSCRMFQVAEHTAAPVRVSQHRHPRRDSAHLHGVITPRSEVVADTQKPWPVDGKKLILPFDDRSLSGPTAGLAKLQETLPELIAGGPDAFLVMLWTLRLEALAPLLKGHTLIANVTTSSTRGAHTHKVLMGTARGAVDTALRYGASAVATHVNIGSRWENEMVENSSLVGQICDREGIEHWVLAYPRGENPDGTDNNYLDMKRNDPKGYGEFVAHCVAIAIDCCGATGIKTQYTGNPETFRSVVEACLGLPVVIAGGPKIGPRDLLTNLYDSQSAGGSGLAGGRNTFNSSQATKVVSAARLVIHENATPEQAIMQCGLCDELPHQPLVVPGGHYLG